MLKKRIRVALVIFVTMFAVLIICSVWWKITEKSSTGTGKIEVITGSAEMVDGVSVSYGIQEKVVNSEIVRAYPINLDRKVEYVYLTKSATIVGNQTETEISYENNKVSELRNRRCTTSFSVVFPQYQKISGRHTVKGSTIYFDLNWYLDDRYSFYRDYREQAGIAEYRINDYVTFSDEDEFLYYYDGEGTDRYEAFFLTTEGDYESTLLCELDEALYAYIDREPYIYFRCIHYDQKSAWPDVWDLEETCENLDDESFVKELSQYEMPEVHMTVNKGIYRFDETGIATCVFPMGEYAEGFADCWLVAEEEANTLTVIGKKENRLLAYRCNLNDGSIEERVLWNAEGEPDAFKAWVESAWDCDMADMVSDGERSYLYWVDGLAVFENENRVFEGRINLPETGTSYGNKFGNQSIGKNSIADKVEIRLTK